MSGGRVEDPSFSDLERMVRASFSAAALPGAVLCLVTAGGSELTVEYGDLAVDTPVMLGSTSKAMTAALLLQHVEEGLIALDDPVTRHLPGVDLPDDVTLSDLACHVSGIRTDARPGHLITRRDRGFAYANQNYNLLGDVLSAVSGVPFSVLLGARLLVPLGMANSGSAPEVVGTRGWTNVFGRNCRAARADYGLGSWIQGPSGGVVASAGDVRRFLSMILMDGQLDGQRVLSRSSIETMLVEGVTVKESPAVRDALGDTGRYGFGWVTKDVEGRTVHTHSGKLPQSTSFFGILPEPGVAFVLVADLGDFLVRTPLLEEIGAAIVRMVLGPPRDEAPTPVEARGRQRILNLAYGAFLTVGVLGWFPRTRPRHPLGSLLYHSVIPAALVAGIRRSSQTPWSWLLRFTPDAVGVLLAGCLSMHLSGLARVLSRGRRIGPRHPEPLAPLELDSDPRR